MADMSLQIAGVAAQIPAFAGLIDKCVISFRAAETAGRRSGGGTVRTLSEREPCGQQNAG